MYTIHDRFRAVIRRNTSETRKWSELEALTGIPATSWQKAYNAKQRPTAEMLEAISRLWPEFAFWLVTGISDAKNGHVACVNGRSKQFYPERPCSLRNAAKPYFTQLIDMFRHCYGEGAGWESGASERAAQVQLLKLEVARDAERQAFSEIEPSSTEVLNLARDSYDRALESDWLSGLPLDTDNC